MKLFPAALAFLLLASAASAAGDASDATMRAFCQILLNITPQGQEGNASNFTVPEIIFVSNHSERYNAAVAALEASNQSIMKMEAAGIGALRARDLYVSAEQWLEGQGALEEIGGEADFGHVMDAARQIAEIERVSFSLRDEFSVLDIRLGNATEGADLSAARQLRQQAEAEFNDGRFEEAKGLIEQAYAEINSAETAAIHSQTLVESTRANIETFLNENWQPIAAALAAIALFLFIFQKRIRRFLLNSRISSLMHEKEVLQSMLRELQRSYFQDNSVNEMAYHIKTKKYGDLIRNINRQLPLLKEELKRI